MRNKRIKTFHSDKGITLVALLITIVVLIILTAVTISAINGKSGILKTSLDAKTKTELASYKEELEFYMLNKRMEDKKFISSTLSAGKNNLSYNTKSEDEVGNIRTVIKGISDRYIDVL